MAWLGLARWQRFLHSPRRQIKLTGLRVYGFTATFWVLSMFNFSQGNLILT